MKKYYAVFAAVLLALSMSACSFGGQNTETTPETTKAPETQAPTTEATLPPVKPNVPEETEGRGSTDDTTDSPNETMPEDVERIRRRIMG